jgi:dTDP-glucose 4,6-dehydratase
MSERILPKRILVTGGAGFIGANFLLRAVPAHQEIAFVNLDKGTYAANPDNLTAISGLPNYRFVRADLAERLEVEAVLAEYAPDWIIHFAAESHVDRSIVRPDDFIRTNVLGTFHLLEACRAGWSGDNHLFVHVSTDEVYGSLGEEGAFTEQTPYDPSSPYSASKASSDLFVQAYHRTYGLPAVTTNCSNNYGPRQFPEKLIPLMILNALEGKPLPVYGAGRNVRDWIYVEDHCAAIWQVARCGRLGERYNIGGNCERANLDVVRAICRLVAQATGRAEAEIAGLITFVADRAGHDFRYAMDNTKIRRELGWEPTVDFDEGLARTVAWYLDNPEWVRRVRTGEYRLALEGHAI